MCSSLAKKIPEQCHFDFEHVSHLFLVFSWLTLNRWMFDGYRFICHKKWKLTKKKRKEYVKESMQTV